jgi:outer membrane receptor protein involved in Fe transport
MNSVYRCLQLTVIGLAAAAGPGARGQTNNPPDAAAGATNAAAAASATNAAAAASPVVGTNVTVLETTTVVGQHLNEVRTEIMPSLGATESIKDQAQILSMSQGADAPISQVITRFPGVAEDSAENGDLHVRGEHGNLQYRIDDVLLPEGIVGFGLELDPRFIQNISLITGSLPAQYGFRTAGVVDIQTKSGALNPGCEASVYGGSYDTFRPSFEYGGSEGKFNYFVDGSYDHNGIGIENPTGSSTPIHDYTEQWKTFLYGSYIIDATSRITGMASASYTQYEVPNTPGLPSGTDPYDTAATVPWSSSPFMKALLPPSGVFNSSALNERQKEQNYYGVVTWQKSTGDLDYQASVFVRRSEVAFTPDLAGDLYFNGVASEVDKALDSAGLQVDGSYHLGEHHTVRAGGQFLEEGVSADSTATAFTLDGAGDPNGLATIQDNHALYGQFAGLYLQDEWKLASWLTLNYGARFDVFSSSFDDENQFSPRVNLVYQPFDGTTMHAGYSRYFTPPPAESVGGGTLAKFAGTANQAFTNLDSAVKAERANYYDVGISQKLAPGLQAGLDGYYKTAQNQLDDGLFGQTLVLSAFNYEKGRVYGLEFTTSYQTNGFSAYANAAYSVAEGQNWDSAQFLFTQGDQAYVQNHLIHLDHDQTYSGTAGVSYRFKETRDASTLAYLDIVAGSGLRQDGGGTEPAADGAGPIPNGATVPAYYSINIGEEQSLKLSRKQSLKVRLDVVNVTDNIYELRSGTGVGVNAAQYGMRRGVFGSLSYQF